MGHGHYQLYHFTKGANKDLKEVEHILFWSQFLTRGVVYNANGVNGIRVCGRNFDARGGRTKEVK